MFEFTKDGCKEARQYLLDMEIPVNPRWSGYELVSQANSLISDLSFLAAIYFKAQDERKKRVLH